ncbi:MAG: hypothetical protein MUE41_08890 [Gemmatimonadaceae bacterium]|jgi:hypothetical protein|nr:hypothetical protein [Gemmatimonadaceae bacterium]
MSYIRSRSAGAAVALVILGAVSPAGARAQTPAAPATRPSGFTLGLAAGVSFVSLRALPTLPAVRRTDLSIGWHAGWQSSGRLAVLLAATSSVYRYPGGGRRRKRGFETITPTIEYEVRDGVRLQAGAGMQLDAPVFWDVRSAPDERRFSRGLGVVVGASITPNRASRFAPELRARWNAGFADVPEGRRRGDAVGLLLGVRRDPVQQNR